MTERQRKIIGLILATGKTVEMLASERGYSKQAIYDVIRGRTRTPHLREFIASFTGKQVKDLWPES